MRYEIKLASTDEELLALYRFRYKIYVEEMQRPQKDADHHNKVITDELDNGAANLIALHNDEIVGAARINLGETITPFYRDFYEIEGVDGCKLKNVSIITRLMVSTQHRNTSLTPKIFVECYEFGIKRCVEYNFIDCNDHLVKLFTSYGCKLYIGKKHHPEYGLVNPMLLDLHDEAHLRAVKSPFLKSYLCWVANKGR